jgi:hypothetical protein
MVNRNFKLPIFDRRYRKDVYNIFNYVEEDTELRQYQETADPGFAIRSKGSTAYLNRHHADTRNVIQTHGHGLFPDRQTGSRSAGCAACTRCRRTVWYCPPCAVRRIGDAGAGRCVGDAVGTAPDGDGTLLTQYGVHARCLMQCRFSSLPRARYTVG